MACLRTAFYSLCVVLMAFPAFAASLPKTEVGLREVVATVEGAFRPDPDRGGQPPLQDVTADFMQSSTLAESRREMRASGEMFFRTATTRDPLMFRFDYYRPADQQIVSNGRTMWVFLPPSSGRCRMQKD